MTRDFDAYDRDFRTDWERSYRSTGYGYERYQPAYQYGYAVGSEPRYRGRQWNDVEADVRRDWETAPSERCVGRLQGRGSPCVGPRADGRSRTRGLREPVCRGGLRRRATAGNRRSASCRRPLELTWAHPQHSRERRSGGPRRKGSASSRLRPGQQQVIEAVLNGRDTLAVMPTGSGKSAIYQIAGALIPGATLVVSPLIALQKDQLDALADGSTSARRPRLTRRCPIRSAKRRWTTWRATGSSSSSWRPSSSTTKRLMQRLAENPPSLFVVDEAHCISEWGHDFRPDYLKLGAVIEQLGHPTVLALTATAAPPVRREIVERLGMRNVAHRGAGL